MSQGWNIWHWRGISGAGSHLYTLSSSLLPALLLAFSSSPSAALPASEAAAEEEEEEEEELGEGSLSTKEVGPGVATRYMVKPATPWQRQRSWVIGGMGMRIGGGARRGHGGVHSRITSSGRPSTRAIRALTVTLALSR